MYIIGVSKIDKQGRVLITGLFGKKEVKRVLAVVDVGYESILLLPLEDDQEIEFGIPLTIDEKNRLIIPKWMRAEIPGITELSLMIDNDKHYLSPKTGSILSSSDDS